MKESGKYRVLVVEDDPGVRSLIGSHLERSRYEVETAGTAEEVVDGLRSGAVSYDVALTDVHLPGMSGVKLNRLLLATSPFSPIIVITGDDDAGLARQALQEGASGYLLKPFELFELDAALAQAVSMLELVEATETLARSQGEAVDDWGELGGSLPRSWLHLGDEKSGAGAGHGARVVSISILLAKQLEDAIDATAREELRTAARTHEIGRLIGSGGRREVATRSSKLLADLGFDERVCELVRQSAEPWSPGLPLRARLLGMADRLDHSAVRRAEEAPPDAEPEEAIRAAVDATIAGRGDTSDPGLVRLLEAQRERVESMWVLHRQAAPGR